MRWYSRQTRLYLETDEVVLREEQRLEVGQTLILVVIRIVAHAFDRGFTFRVAQRLVQMASLGFREVRLHGVEGAGLIAWHTNEDVERYHADRNRDQSLSAQ